MAVNVVPTAVAVNSAGNILMYIIMAVLRQAWQVMMANRNSSQKRGSTGMTNRTSKIVNISPRPATLKRKIRSHLRVLGFRKTKDGFLYVADGSKDSIRLLHASQRNDRLEATGVLFRNGRLGS